MEQWTREILRRAVKPTHFRTIYTNGINDTWSADIAEMPDQVSDNEGHKSMLVVIDCFSRYAWAVPLRQKSAAAAWSAFETVMQAANASPTQLWVDKGTEFYNSQWTAHLKKKNIERYSTYGQSKACMAERFIQTMKKKIWFHFLSRGTRKWIDVLKDIIEDYNNTEHSAIGMSPADAQKKENEKRLMKKLYHSEPLGKPKYDLGQWVRISRMKEKFEKGFHPNWSYEIFKITGIRENEPVTYSLCDYYGENIEGSFYEAELQPVADPSFFPVEEVLKKRTIKGKKEVLAKLIGYERPVWMPAQQAEEITK